MSIDLEGVTREYCVTSKGTIRLKNCIVNSCVKGTKNVFISGGSVAGAVSSSTGMVMMDNTSSDAVTGQNDVELLHVCATWVKSDSGGVKLTNCELSGDVHAKHSVFIVGCNCQDVDSFRLYVSDSNVGTCHSVDSVILIDTHANSVVVDPSIRNGGMGRDTDVMIRDSYIQADVIGQSCIVLNESTVIGYVQCNGPVKAKGCVLSNITGSYSITLDSTIATIVTVNVDGESAYLYTMNGSLFEKVIVKQISRLSSRVQLHINEPITCPIEFQGCDGEVICK